MNAPQKPEKCSLPVPSEPREIDFRDLAEGEKEVIICLEGKKYRLLLTKNGKLVLNR